MTPRRLPPPAPVPAGPLVLPTPTSWARERIAAARQLGPVPSYGSSEWEDLADDDPRKLAAALIAAEVQRYEAATLAERLWRELDQIATDHAIEDGATGAMARDEQLAAHARTIRPRPSFAELEARRAGATRREAAAVREDQAHALARSLQDGPRLRAYPLTTPRRRRQSA